MNNVIKLKLKRHDDDSDMVEIYSGEGSGTTLWGVVHTDFLLPLSESTRLAIEDDPYSSTRFVLVPEEPLNTLLNASAAIQEFSDVPL